MPVRSAPIPNVRTILAPDPGHLMVKGDLKGADVQAVAWDSDCQHLKNFFKKHRYEGLGIHAYNAMAIYGKLAGADGKAMPYYKYTKEHCHAYNYYGTPRGLAKRFGYWTVHEEEAFQKRWFSLCPEIPQWHKRLTQRIRNTKTIRNAFGYRKIYHEAPEAILPEACAWIGQGTVSIVKNEALITLDEQYSDILDLLLDEHDEIVFQIRDECIEQLPAVKSSMEIPVPYADPLVIPWEFKESRVSWGDCA